MCWNWVGRWQSVPGMQVAILWALINTGVAMTTVPGPAEELEDGQFVLLRKSEDDNYVTCSAKHAARKQRRSRKQSMVSWEKGSLCQCVCGYVWEECCGYVWEECLRACVCVCVCACVVRGMCLHMCVCIHMCVCMCFSTCVWVGNSGTACVHTYVGKIVFVFVHMWVLGRLCFSEDCVCVCPHVGVGKTVFQWRLCLCLSTCGCWEDCVSVKIVFVFVLMWVLGRLCFSEDCVCVCPHVGVGKTVFQWRLCLCLSSCGCWEDCVSVKIVFVFVHMWVLGRLCFSEDWEVCLCLSTCGCWEDCVSVKIVFVFVHMWVLGRLCFSASVSVWVCWEECVYFSASVSVSVGVGVPAYVWVCWEEYLC